MDEMQQAWDEYAKAWNYEEQKIAREYNVSDKCAAAIMYLRTRSRWTQDKEMHLVELDHNGQSLPNVYAGEF